jgi:hypothetical protein
VVGRRRRRFAYSGVLSSRVVLSRVVRPTAVVGRRRRRFAYSGGGGGDINCGGDGGGGGGGSYNSADNQENQAGFQAGHGSVTFGISCE